MDRRKFVIGAGSLAAGGAAAMGTGAFASVEATRSVSVNVAGDGSAYLGLEDTSPYAETNGKQMELNFANNGNGGSGINADSVSTFDGVFRMTNNGPEDLDITIDKSGLANPERWHFVPKEVYDEYSGNYPEDSFYPSWDNYGGYETTNASAGGLDSGNSTLVGVAIDARDLNSVPGGEIIFAVTDEDGPYGSNTSTPTS
ncbi:hypothetical protein EXE41_01395 [Halorubrum sp. SD690R]|uniref:hypothetical protein n=1 Tax=Halorubrum sp. SD690R TaxID=2518117 RepID=UPI0010F541F2|nr:hypothetical protein [Halorubrum sp. SD690R]TKX48031.1 hypothetical protein EXE41_01395 [Halorubrum sp. SD690R]